MTAERKYCLKKFTPLVHNVALYRGEVDGAGVSTITPNNQLGL